MSRTQTDEEQAAMNDLRRAMTGLLRAIQSELDAMYPEDEQDVRAHLDNIERLIAATPAASERESIDVVLIDGSVWPWPGNTALPWQVWNEVPHPDGMTIYDPDGFRFGKPTVVTWVEFERARTECTLISDREVR